MKNSDVFTSSGYDMVVAVTQKAVNDQLTHLADPDIGAINTSFILGMTDDGPTFYKSSDQVPKTASGKPKGILIDGTFSPRIAIEASGTDVVLILSFSKGSAWLRDPIQGVLQESSMAGWQYGINIRLDFAGIARSDIQAGKAVPKIVADKLTNFLSEGFAVAQMFLNFERSDLVNFNPIHTNTDKAPGAEGGFVFMMNKYLEHLKKNSASNPFILGYTITHQAVGPDPDKSVPPNLKPIGQTFTVYHDEKDADLSTINFILNTEGGWNPKLSEGSHPTPGNFDSNWIGASEQCDGKMIYSSFSFYEKMILEPFYKKFSRQITKKYKDAGIDVPDAPEYKAAKSGGGSSVSFNISDNEDGDHRYINKYTASVSNPSESSVTIRFAGSVTSRKTVKKNLPFCQAEAWAEATTNWTTDILITDTKDKNGKPIIEMKTSDPDVSMVGPKTWQNDCASDWEEVARILGGLLDVLKTIFTFGTNKDPFFTNLLLELVTPRVGDYPGPSAFVGSLDDNINTTFMLPAGHVFFSKKPDIDSEGDFNVELTYKTATYHLTTNEGSYYSDGYEAEYAYEETPYSRLVSIPNLDNVLQAQTAAGQIENKDQSHKSGTNPSPLAAPMLDEITLTAVSPQHADGLKATVSSELMTNVQQALPVAPTSDFDVVKDSGGRPVIFAIGSKGNLHMLQSTSGSNPDGWSSTDLLQSFDNHSHVVQFDVTQDAKGRISLAFILGRKGEAATDVFYASMLSDDVAKLKSSGLKSLATKVDGIGKDFVGRNIKVGSSDDNRRPLLVVVGDVHGSRYYYQVKHDTNAAARMEFPEALNTSDDGLIGLQMGFNFSQRANYFLYKIGESKSLVAKTLADDKQGSVSYDYSPASLPEAYRHLEYNNIAVSTSRAESDHPSSDIYVGAATGLYRIPHGRSDLMEQITGSIKDVRKIKIAKEGLNDLSLWVEASPSFLYLVRGTRRGEHTIDWNDPVLFAQNVVHVAPLRTVKSPHSLSTNELFTLDSEQTITHYWQDPSSTFWKHRTARTGNNDYVVNFNSFTTQFHLADASGLPARTKVKITSSEWQYATVNGLVYSLDSDSPAEIETDELGDVTIITAASDISPPVIHIAGDTFKETLSIYPNGKIQHHLGGITDGASLREARTQDGKPVLKDGTSNDVSDGVAYSLSTIQKSIGDKFPPAKSGNTFTVVETPNPSTGRAIKHSLHADVSFSAVPDGFSIGFVTEGGSWTPLDREHTEKFRLIARSPAVKSIGDVFGDIWHWLEHAFHDVVEVVKDGAIKLADGVRIVISKLGDALHFVLHVGEKIINFALDTLAKAYKGLSFLLNLVGIGVGKVLAWIGHLLGWDHIWATHKVIANVSRSFLDYGVTEAKSFLENARREVGAFFSTIGDTIKNLELSEEMKGQTITSMHKMVAASTKSQPDVSRNSPTVNMTAYHLRHAAPLNKEDEATSTNGHADLGAGDPVVQLFNDVLKPVFETVEKKLAQTGTDIAALLKEGTLADLQRVCLDFIDTFISALAAFVDGLLKFVEDILTDIQAGLEKTLDVPIFGALYEFVCGLMGEKEPLSIINVASLVAAIPAVTITKIAAGSTPDQWLEGIDPKSLPAALADCVKALNPDHATPVSSEALASPDPQNTNPEQAASTSDDKFKCPEPMRVLSHIEGVVAPICAIASSIPSAIEGVASVSSVKKPSNSIIQICTKIRHIKTLFTMPITQDNQVWGAYVARWAAWILSNAQNIICNGFQPQISNMAGVLVNMLCLLITLYVDESEGAQWSTWLIDIASSLGGCVENVGNIIERPLIMLAGLGVSQTMGSAGSEVKAVYTIGTDKVWAAVNLGGS
ncbi:hypothetical protein EKO27_g4066 [Xylaria grammica]|uniref:Uncharacterized protein n=1 Tax=Xylaria grammica TaxID=363999 RepID=A0A439D9H0_9PEZI|nr:hypothetical protein EKO27_g4066 [Xylaria grammica]